MTKTVDPYDYNITLRAMVFDGDPYFEARVKELPDVREYGEAAREAYDGAIDTIESGNVHRRRQIIPVVRRFSGVTLEDARPPAPSEELHRALCTAGLAWRVAWSTLGCRTRNPRQLSFQIAGELLRAHRQCCMSASS